MQKNDLGEKIGDKIFHGRQAFTQLPRNLEMEQVDFFKIPLLIEFLFND